MVTSDEWERGKRGDDTHHLKGFHVRKNRGKSRFDPRREGKEKFLSYRADTYPGRT